ADRFRCLSRQWCDVGVGQQVQCCLAEDGSDRDGGWWFTAVPVQHSADDRHEPGCGSIDWTRYWYSRALSDLWHSGCRSRSAGVDSCYGFLHWAWWFRPAWSVGWLRWASSRWGLRSAAAAAAGWAVPAEWRHGATGPAGSAAAAAWPAAGRAVPAEWWVPSTGSTRPAAAAAWPAAGRAVPAEWWVPTTRSTRPPAATTGSTWPTTAAARWL